MRRLRVLIVTNLYPNNADPGFAPFNRQQFAELGELCDLEIFGVVPWRFGSRTHRGQAGQVASKEWIDGLPVRHPRFATLPGLPSLNAGLYTVSVAPEIILEMVRRRRRFDVMLAAYAYPDGVAGVAMGAMLRMPVVVKCHGSDLNRVPDDPPAKLQLQQMLPRANAVVTVSKKLKERAMALGVPESLISVVYNGVDSQRFFVRDRMEARRNLRLPQDRELVLYVGSLAEHKGARDLFDAAKLLAEIRPKASVLFVGDGPLARPLHDMAEEMGSGGHVLVVGHVSHDEVAEYMAACDVLCLPSWNEGLPNVVREAHASGRPVVATAVGGVPEAVDQPILGRLVAPKDPRALAQTIAAQLASESVAPEDIVRVAAIPSWRQSAEQLLTVLQRAARA